MRKNIIYKLFLSFTAVLLFNGCTGNELTPNNATQTGAITGALTGAVIGYNTKGHHKGQRAVIGGILGAAIGTGAGNVMDNNHAQPTQTGGWQ